MANNNDFQLSASLSGHEKDVSAPQRIIRTEAELDYDLVLT